MGGGKDTSFSMPGNSCGCRYVCVMFVFHVSQTVVLVLQDLLLRRVRRNYRMGGREGERERGWQVVEVEKVSGEKEHEPLERIELPTLRAILLPLSYIP